MFRRARWIVVAVVVAVLAVAVAAVVLVQPDLSEARDRVDARWTVLRDPLGQRYTALAGVSQAFTAAGGGDRTVVAELDAELRRWSALAARGDRHTDPAAEVASANALEALARRARAGFQDSLRLKGNAGIGAAFAAFDQAFAAPEQVSAYNSAVRRYEDRRRDLLGRALAAVLGYEPRAELVG